MKEHISNIRAKIHHHKTLVQNFSYLSALQVFNTLIPLITYPYLIRVLGKETYGLVVFAQAIIGYLNILIGFGFDISAVKDISINRNNPMKLSEIISSILILKFILFLVSLIILIVLIHFIPQAQKYRALYYMTMLMSISTVIYPSWHFQGIEQMKYITYLNLISRLIFVALIFVLIHSPEDYLFMPLTSGVGAILAGLISLYIIFVLHKIKFNFQPLRILKYYLKESVPIFVSNVSILLYTGTNKVICGAFLGMSEVAYYDLAEKVISLSKTPIQILSQSLFPKINKEKNILFIRKMLKIGFVATLFIFLIIELFANNIVYLLGGKEMVIAANVLRILSITILPISIATFYATLTLIPYGFTKIWTWIIVSSGLIYVFSFLLFLALNTINIYSICCFSIICEFYILIYSYYKCKKLKLL